MELLALIILGGGLYAFGWHRGHMAADKAYMGVHIGTEAGKCCACGVLVEGGGLEMEAHTRFYCKKGT